MRKARARHFELDKFNPETRKSSDPMLGIHRYSVSGTSLIFGTIRYPPVNLLPDITESHKIPYLQLKKSLKEKCRCG